jgi:ribose 5-phosphate isomerase B
MIQSRAMRIAIGADHAGFALKEHLKKTLSRLGHQVEDLGTHSDTPVDYPPICAAVGRMVSEGRVDRGVVLGGSGQGEQIAANKVPGIRAALCGDAQTAAGARKWNDANVLALSLRTTSEAELGEILDAWFGTEPSAETDDRANVEHLAEIESAD